MPFARKSPPSPQTRTSRPALTLVPRTPAPRERSPWHLERQSQTHPHVISTEAKRSGETPEFTSRRSPLALWHLLSLDAPSVATVWMIAIARSAGLHLAWTAPAAMFLAVWILYAADRLLDSRLLADNLHGTSAPPADLEERHLFHHRHRRAFLAVIVAAAIALAVLLRSIDIHALRLYTLLATLLAAYFLLIHARPGSAHRLPKELAVGIFFPAAVFIPTVARDPHLRAALLPTALLLAALCSLNCLFLYAWEHPGPRLNAHWSTRWATRHLVPLTAAVAALALYCLLSTRLLSSLPACILVSSLLLLTLDVQRHRLQPIHLRALADLVLLSPLLLPAAALKHLANWLTG